MEGGKKIKKKATNFEWSNEKQSVRRRRTLIVRRRATLNHARYDSRNVPFISEQCLGQLSKAVVSLAESKNLLAEGTVLPQSSWPHSKEGRGFEDACFLIKSFVSSFCHRYVSVHGIEGRKKKKEKEGKKKYINPSPTLILDNENRSNTRVFLLLNREK